MDSNEYASSKSSHTNYVAYHDPTSGRSRIGHYDLDEKTIQPLSFISGTPIENLYQVIEAGESNIVTAGGLRPAINFKVLPPLADRDILCVGKNYAEHAKEFNSSGFDSSDKVDQPSHPVIFTKRFTSIISDGDEIYPHPEFTQTVDYEGEIGVIIGKPGFRVSEADAMSHVWGYTIVNDVTARERQRDHKQFYIGKSPDTFCPMSAASANARQWGVTTRCNHTRSHLFNSDPDPDYVRRANTVRSSGYEVGVLSQMWMIDDVNIYIEMPGDVLATGTPVGVGIGKNPPVYLKSGDLVAISVNGLGTLTNRVADTKSCNPSMQRIQSVTHIRRNNVTRSINTALLTTINNKPLYYKNLGCNTGSPVIFVHGLGGNNEIFTPLVQSLNLHQSYKLHLFDFEGHGLSPTSPLSKLSIESLAGDLNGVFEHANVSSGATIIAHSMSCLIAMRFALSYPQKVSKLVLLAPPPLAISEPESQMLHAQAQTARTQGMMAIADAFAANAVTEQTKISNPLAVAAIRMSLLGQDPEGYAKACTAMAETNHLELMNIMAKTSFVIGSLDKVSSPQLCESYGSEMGGRASVKIVDGAGHWHILEDLPAVAEAVKKALS